MVLVLLLVVVVVLVGCSCCSSCFVVCLVGWLAGWLAGWLLLFWLIVPRSVSVRNTRRKHVSFSGGMLEQPPKTSTERCAGPTYSGLLDDGIVVGWDPGMIWDPGDFANNSCGLLASFHIVSYHDNHDNL